MRIKTPLNKDDSIVINIDVIVDEIKIGMGIYILPFYTYKFYRDSSTFKDDLNVLLLDIKSSHIKAGYRSNNITFMIRNRSRKMYDFEYETLRRIVVITTSNINMSYYNYLSYFN